MGSFTPSEGWCAFCRYLLRESADWPLPLWLDIYVCGCPKPVQARGTHARDERARGGEKVGELTR
jgi:hypothetical protein